MIFGMIAILGLISVIVAKFYTTKRSYALRQEIAEIQKSNSKVKGELRMAESAKAAAIHELNSEKRKLRTLKLRVEKYDKEIESFKK